MTFAIVTALLILNFLFIDWILAIIWITIEFIYSKNKNIKCYKREIIERRELLKKHMVDRLKDSERLRK